MLMERLMDKNALMECIYVANDRTRTHVVKTNRSALLRQCFVTFHACNLSMKNICLSRKRSTRRSILTAPSYL
jgi:hypothetical protein